MCGIDLIAKLIIRTSSLFAQRQQHAEAGRSGQKNMRVLLQNRVFSARTRTSACVFNGCHYAATAVINYAINNVCG